MARGKDDAPISGERSPLVSNFLRTSWASDDMIHAFGEDALDADVDVTAINVHTHNIEHHGKTSPMAFLASIQQTHRENEPASGMDQQATAERNQTCLVSILHNTAFSTDSLKKSTAEESDLCLTNHYFRQSRLFIDGYFENLHLVHPILVKDIFLARCEDLWFGREDNQPRSFIALYYSLLSLGALTRVWDEETIDSTRRFEWSRKLFNHALCFLNELRAGNDLETVQYLMLMAKICQNELNPHLAYTYLGMATRASLSAGHNREPTGTTLTDPVLDRGPEISRTWWALYALETEASFAVGRPDSVGSDEYHTRSMPPMADNETALISSMVELARITRKIAVSIYLTESSIHDRMLIASQLEKDMDVWLKRLPYRIKPEFMQSGNQPGIAKDPKWARRQRLVVNVRYLNTKMVLYKPFLMRAARDPETLAGILAEPVAKCVDAASKTVITMHDTFCQRSFFRAWWYNTTYTLYAASILLCYATRLAPPEEWEFLFDLVGRAVEVFESMDESIVAKRSNEVVKRALAYAKNIPAFPQEPNLGRGVTSMEPGASHPIVASNDPNDPNSSNLTDIMLSDGDFDFGQSRLHFEDGNYLF